MNTSLLQFSSEIENSSQVGGKAAALAKLADAGFRVPPFFVALPGTPGEAILEAFDRCFSDGARVACRSSAPGEDSEAHSFAGQFDSYLDVGRDEVISQVERVWFSAQQERVKSYGKSLEVNVRQPAALVQLMVDPVLAGVAFSADPVSGRRQVAIVSAVPGLGESLVSGAMEGITLAVSRDGLVLERRGDLTISVSDAFAVEVAELARQAAAHFGRPQDIEWAVDAEGRLHLLQSRPITTLESLPDPDARRILWDNSNIAESYSGVTTPLTFSFARRAYEHVYREFCRLLWVPEGRVARGDAVFRCMIGLVRGRIYYNLDSWYRVLAMLPGFQLNRAFMEQMMGVREPMPEALVAEIERKNTVGPLRDAWHLARTLAGLGFRAAGLSRSMRRFRARLDDALGATPIEIDRLSADELVAHYRDLEHRLLRRWDAPLVNDFFAMIACGVLRKLAAGWLGDESLANEGLRDIGDIISLEPARRIQAMAKKRARGESIEMDLAEYLAVFGDRCVEELKLESATLADDPAPLRHSIEALAARVSEGDQARVMTDSTESRLESALRAVRPLRRWLFRRVLGVARRRVRDRENLRFERTRLFGRVRRIMRALGARLVESRQLEQPDDVFYGELEELLGFFDGTAAAPITPGVIAARKEVFSRYRESEAPPDRFETLGSPSVRGSIVRLGNDQKVDLESSTGLSGVGACAGKVRGPVRVVLDPRGVSLEPGEILVAQQTDPGWVVLFPAAAGLLVERGSLLSHSAIVAREMEIPAIVSLPGITSRLRDGDWVEMDGAAGTVRPIERPMVLKTDASNPEAA